eukprot:TRINITY_DN51271_c0_g1_i2.p1 TRINITY_DN51271_c0_g1~~TRINITY_DN51271_c0_g1_i2.p1  ORF type:complete len:152 (-),score=19.02 TRINITY_DN51271_c0_g1_i2:439-870(-)
MAAYDDNNIFAKILRGDIPSYKIFETDACLAILDAFPMAVGHSLLIPKAKAATLDEMSAEDAAAALKELPRLVAAVKEATGCNGCNVVQNNGPESGQVVPHVHFHVIPREGPEDGRVKYGASGKQIEAEQGNDLLAKFKSVLK